MKIFKFIFLAVLTVSLVACDSDDDSTNNDTTNADLVGTWQGEDMDYSGTSETQAQGQTVTSSFVGEAIDVDYTLTFTEDPNMVTSNGSYGIELTTTSNGQTVTQTIDNLTFLETGVWTRTGNTLTIDSDGEASAATIEQLTENALRIAVTEVETITQGDFSVTTTTNLVATFVR